MICSLPETVLLLLLIGLKQRLEIKSDDVDGWVLLSKSYFHLNRLNEANEAFEKAKTLGYSDNWKPLPQISSASQQNYSSQNTPAEEGIGSSEQGDRYLEVQQNKKKISTNYQTRCLRILARWWNWLLVTKFRLFKFSGTHNFELSTVQCFAARWRWTQRQMRSI